MSYGGGSMAMAPYFLISGSFLLYATAILGVPPEIAGMIMAASTLWDAAIDIPLGWWSDRMRSRRFGRRHPFLIVGGLATAALTAVLWSIPQDMGPTATIAWLAVSVIGLKTAIAAFVVPHTALGGEIADDYDGRMVAQGYRGAFQLIGMILALVGSNVFFFRPTAEYAQGQLNPHAYAPMGFVCAALALGATLWTVLGTRSFIPKLQATELGHDSLRAQFGGFLRDADLRALLLMILAIELPFQLVITLGGHLNTYTYGMSGPQMGALALAVLLSAALSQPLWIHVSRRYDKKPALLAAVVLAMLGFVGGPLTHVAWGWFPLTSASDAVWTLMPFQILAGIGVGAFSSLPYSMVNDCSQARERRTGRSVTGGYTGMYIFAYKLGSGLSIAASGWLLRAIGFDAALPAQSEHTRYWLAVAPALLLFFGMPVVFWALRGYRLSRADFGNA
ncbi:MAG: MFS transporter [Lysobacter sp.]|nr:MFS transporter [Lysobacter sp.]